jgi:hypothetical protein
MNLRKKDDRELWGGAGGGFAVFRGVFAVFSLWFRCGFTLTRGDHRSYKAEINS